MSKKMFGQIALLSVGITIGTLFQPLSVLPSFAQAGCQSFPETGKQVCGRFLQYWQQNGGLAQQGLPLSSEFTEVSELNGQPYTVQYFERAVFEKHPENQPPYDVLLSQLGTFQFERKYPNGEPGSTTPPPPPVPTPTPGSTSGALFEEPILASYSSEYEDLVLVGVYKYNGTLPIADLDLAITETDPNGNVMATESVYSMPDKVAPGGLLPFRIRWDHALPPGHNLNPTLQGGETDGFYIDYYTTDIAVVQATLTEGSIWDNGKKVVGRVRNDSGHSVGAPTVYAVLWDANNNLVDAESGSTSLDNLSPGQEGAFELDTHNGATAARVDIVVYARVDD